MSESPWSKHESKSKPGIFYYFNDVTGETKWTPPSNVEPSSPKSTTPVSTPMHKSSTSQDKSAGNQLFGKKVIQKKKGSSRGRQDSAVSTSSRSFAEVEIEKPEEKKEEPVVIKFTAKMAVRLLSGKDLSSSKASYTCELSLFRLHLNEHVEIVEETVKSAVADGIAPHWNRMFKIEKIGSNCITILVVIIVIVIFITQFLF